MGLELALYAKKLVVHENCAGSQSPLKTIQNSRWADLWVAAPADSGNMKWLVFKSTSYVMVYSENADSF